MSSTNPKSDGRLLFNLFFRVLPAQIFLLMLTRINNIVDGLVGYAIVALCGPVLRDPLLETHTEDPE